MNKIYDFFFGTVRTGRPSSGMYKLLWGVGLGGAIASYVELKVETQLGARLGDLIAFVFATATIAQQWTVYSDIHSIEESPHLAARDYPVWLNTRLEWTMRVGIIFFLLFGVGKIADGFSPLLERVPCQFLTESKACETLKVTVIEFLRPQDPATNFSRNLFVTGTVFVFVLLALWNIFALGFRYGNWKSTLPPEEKAHEIVVTARILWFSVLSVVCAVFWISVFLDSRLVADVAELLIVSYLLAVLIVILLRSNRPSTWVERQLTAFIK